MEQQIKLIAFAIVVLNELVLDDCDDFYIPNDNDKCKGGIRNIKGNG